LWINENLIVDWDLNKYLPGPYTLILKKKSPKFLNWVSPTVFFGSEKFLTTSLPKIIQKAHVPFITTSVNLSGDPFITKIPDIHPDILENIDHIIDYGELNGRPSILIIEGKEVKR
jgi:tRNA A37 threonylcarbamoyladenosine synthetase subunit TsaC/SUA5/YrdC